MSYVHIHAPRFVLKAAHTTICLDCKRRTRILSFFYEWYGWNGTCIKCGREWSDSQWMPLDFKSGVRQENIERAKRMFREACAPRDENLFA